MTWWLPVLLLSLFCLARTTVAAHSPWPLEVSESCFNLQTSIQTHTVEQRGRMRQPVSMESHVEGDDGGFELRVRRTSDRVMANWYVPDREYEVLLTNRFHLVGFQNAILWLSMAKGKTNSMMEMSMVSYIIIPAQPH